MRLSIIILLVVSPFISFSQNTALCPGFSKWEKLMDKGKYEEAYQLADKEGTFDKNMSDDRTLELKAVKSSNNTYYFELYLSKTNGEDLQKLDYNGYTGLGSMEDDIYAAIEALKKKIETGL
jgi:hypothetical protein